eukprot:1143336-Pyramimonas_sp.AAC.1
MNNTGHVEDPYLNNPRYVAVAGLELYTEVLNVAEQARLVEAIRALEAKGHRGELKGRTFSAPRKWMKGKGRVTMQFGCVYNYATDKEVRSRLCRIDRSDLVKPPSHSFERIQLSPKGSLRACWPMSVSRPPLDPL